jgi:hypothetical protein
MNHPSPSPPSLAPVWQRGKPNSRCRLLPTSLSFSHHHSRTRPGKAWPLPVAVGSARPITCKVWCGPSPSWRGHGTAVGHHGMVVLWRATMRAVVLWCSGCVVDGRHKGGREGHEDFRRQRGGLLFMAAALLLGSTHGPNLGPPWTRLGQRSVRSFCLSGTAGSA